MPPTAPRPIALEYGGNRPAGNRLQWRPGVADLGLVGSLVAAGAWWSTAAWRDLLDPAEHWKHPRPFGVNVAAFAAVAACTATAGLLFAVMVQVFRRRSVRKPVAVAAALGLLASLCSAVVVLTLQRWWFGGIPATDIAARLCIALVVVAPYPAAVVFRTASARPACGSPGVA